MAKYLMKVTYTTRGMQGLVKDGGSARKAVAEQTLGRLGGTMEAYYYAFGEADVYVIADLPDHTAAAAAATHIRAAGGATVETVVLLTAEEIDQAADTPVEYRAPGT